MNAQVNSASSYNDTSEISGEIIAEVKDLEVEFGKNKVLKGLSIQLHKGENLVVLGKSGSGKSVFIKCLMGLIEANAGRIELFGNDISKLTEAELNKLRKRIGFLFQGAALYDSMTVGENLEFPLRNEKNIDEEEMQKRVEEALQNVGLPEVIDKMPSELSGGMRKRVGLARTLILKPEIILYDEPTTGLDPVTGKEISNLILSVQKKFSTSSIIITHDKECAKITANRVLMINDGVCAASGTYSEFEVSEDKLIRSFFE